MTQCQIETLTLTGGWGGGWGGGVGGKVPGGIGAA